MEVQQSDAVVSNGKIYRVKMPPDGTLYASTTRPDFGSGTQVLDGITWVMTQEIVSYTAGVRNVVFRDIQLEKPRAPFSIEFNMGRYNRSYHAGAEIPVQENILLDNVKVLFDDEVPLVNVTSPVNMITIANSRLRRVGLRFQGNESIEEYLRGHGLLTMARRASIFTAASSSTRRDGFAAQYGRRQGDRLDHLLERGVGGRVLRQGH